MRMHRIVMNAGKGKVIDHINGNGLDNQKKNLRECTHAENCKNMGQYASNTSGYKGVSWNKCRGMWQAYIKDNGKQRHLGYFPDVIQAAKAYNKASKKYYGKFGKPNVIKRHE